MESERIKGIGQNAGQKQYAYEDEMLLLHFWGDVAPM